MKIDLILGLLVLILILFAGFNLDTNKVDVESNTETTKGMICKPVLNNTLVECTIPRGNLEYYTFKSTKGADK